MRVAKHEEKESQFSSIKTFQGWKNRARVFWRLQAKAILILS